MPVLFIAMARSDPTRALLAIVLALLSGCGQWITDGDACDPGVVRIRWYPDTDGDGYGDPSAQGLCEDGPGLVDNADDCDDSDTTVTTVGQMGEVPGLTLWYRDADNDGYGDDDDTLLTCAPPAEYSAREGGDCDDGDDGYSLLCPWVDVVAGRAWSCGLRRNGAVSCWGDTEAGGYNLDGLPREDVETLEGGNFVACALSDGAVSCSYSGLDLDIADAVGVEANWSRACAWDAAGDFQCAAVSGVDPDRDWLYTNAPTGKVRSITLGNSFACAVMFDGSLECWGMAEYPLPLDSPAGNDWVEARGGFYMACALDVDGRVTCWGVDPLSEDFAAVPDGDGFVKLAGTRLQMCALHESGSLTCWGGPDADGTPPTAHEPYVAVSASGGIDSSGNTNLGHACAVGADGEMDCWGYGAQGQTTVPNDDYSTTALSLAGDASCALHPDGGLDCWGDAPDLPYRPAALAVGRSYAAGVTDDGDLVFWLPAWTPTVDSTASTQTTAVRNYSSSTDSDEALCTLDSAGFIACWASDLNADVYQEVPQGAGYIDVAPGSLHGCALDALGQVECWAHVLVLDRIADAPTDAGYVQISAGSLHTCAVHGDGSLVCWGDDSEEGVSGAPTGTDFVSVSVHNSSSCGLHDDGTVSCWGAPDSLVVAGTPTDDAFDAVSVAHDLACGVRADGTVACWGDDRSISMGGVAALDEITALAVGYRGICVVGAYRQVTCLTPDGSGELEGILDNGTIGGVDAIALGRDHTCAVRGGRLHCYGDDSLGQSSPPSMVAASVVVGGRHSCALNGAGEATCWGSDRLGQASPPDETWVELSAGDAHTCGVTAGGVARCWGDIDDPPTDALDGVASGPDTACGLAAGAIECWGDGEMASQSPPSGSYVALAAGDHHACALDNDGLASCWGDDRNGQVSDTPPYVFVAIAAGAAHTCGIKLDGWVHCWGADLEGQSSPPRPTEAR